MTEQYELSVDEFVDLIRPELEHQVDELIAAEPAEHRLVLMAHRELIVERFVAFTRSANIQHRAQPWLRYKQ